jgi:hypothetical protein
MNDGKVYLMERRKAMTPEQREQMDKRLNTVEVVIDTDKFLEMDSAMHGDGASAGSSKQSNGDPSVPGRRGHKDRGEVMDSVSHEHKTQADASEGLLQVIKGHLSTHLEGSVSFGKRRESL